MLELDGLDVRYGSVPAVRGLNLEVGRGELVGLIGPNGAGQVDDAARDHGRRPGRGRRRPARGPVAPRPRAGGDRARRDRARAGGAADLRRAHGRGEPAARARGAARATARGSARGGLRALPDAGRVPRAARPARSPAASSSSSRSGARSSPARTCSCSTSPRSGSRRRSSTPSSPRSPRSASAASPILLVEQRAQRTVALADRTLRARERRAADDADPGRRGRHREDDRGVPRMIRRRASTPRRSSTPSASAPSTR